MLSLEKLRDGLSWKQSLELKVTALLNTLIAISSAKGYIMVEGGLLEHEGTNRR